MAANSLIVEVGEKIVKVIVSTKKNRKFQILDSFMFQTPERSVVDGQIVDLEIMAEALREQMAANDVKNVKKVMYTLNSSKVATREVTLPLVKENKIRSVIETNAPDYFPVDLSGYQLAYNILEKVKGTNGGYRILVLAVPRTMINSYIRLTEVLGLPIEAIDYCGNSQYQVLRQIRNDGVVMYVDINVTNTYVNFMDNGILLLQRNLNLGGDPIVNAVMRKDRQAENSYLSVLQNLSDETYMNQVLPMAERRMAVVRLSQNVMRMMDFFRTNYKGRDISKIVLMGTCSNMAGLVDMVKEDTGIDAVHIYELDEMKALADSEDGVTFYLSCIGTLIAPLNLLPEDYATRKKRQKKNAKKAEKQTSTATAKAFFLVCLVISLLTAAYGGAMYYINSMKLEEMQARAAQLTKMKDVYNTYLTYDQTNKNLEVLKGYKETPNANLVKFFEELEEKMPEELTFLSAECTNEGVVMNITTPSFDEAAVTIAQFRTFESIQDFQVSEMVKSESERGEESISFSITGIYQGVVIEEE